MWKGGVSLFYREDPKVWHVESEKVHDTNVVSCIIASGYMLWLLIGSYISPTETSEVTLQYIEEAAHRYRYPKIICDDFNISMDSQKERDLAIRETLCNIGFF